MFRDDQQSAAVARVLMRSVRLSHLWDGDRPTAEAVDLMQRGGGPLSSGQALMLLVVFDLWNGEGHAQLGRVLAVLDATRLQLVASLLYALATSASAVDDWLEYNAATVV